MRQAGNFAICIVNAAIKAAATRIIAATANVLA